MSLKIALAPTAEVKKSGKARRQAEDTPKSHLAAGRTACKNWQSFICTLGTLHQDFIDNRSYFSSRSFCKKQGLVR